MPVLDAHSMEIISRSAEQTQRAGMRLGALLSIGDVVCMVGDLGAGKTTLAKGISAGWGSLDSVTSPTFVLVNVYRRADGSRLYHLDAYRLENPAEALDLDIDAMVQTGSLIVEWADRIQSALPGDCLWVRLIWVDEDQRDLVISASGERAQKIVSELRKEIYGIT